MVVVHSRHSRGTLMTSIESSQRQKLCFGLHCEYQLRGKWMVTMRVGNVTCATLLFTVNITAEWMATICVGNLYYTLILRILRMIGYSACW
jgi:hypothetical protein